MRISVFGAGYVGLVTAACFAEVGHHVTCCDTAADRIASLRDGRELLNRDSASGSHDEELEYQTFSSSGVKLPINDESFNRRNESARHCG